MRSFNYVLFLVAAIAACGPGATPPDAGTGDLGAESGFDLRTPILDGGALPEGRVCTPERWCWESALPQGNSLVAVWASSANDVWAVGEHRTAIHWDGNLTASETGDYNLGLVANGFFRVRLDGKDVTSAYGGDGTGVLAHAHVVDREVMPDG